MHRTIIWVVIANGDRPLVLVRSVRGPKGNWYRRLLANPQGTLVAGAERIPVQAHQASEDEIAQASDGFRKKYKADQHLYAVLRPEVVAATLRLAPRDQ